MKLLIITQTVDQNDLMLGFFHRWLEEFSTRFDSIHVICLFEGAHALPKNVHVHSLGKEKGPASSIIYGIRFLRLLLKLKREYDVVFVHMNQEYVIIAGWVWKLLGKRIYLWRNHYAGSVLTDLAAAWCTKVFCTSEHSYTAKYTKTLLMPVGVDTKRFSLGDPSLCVARSVLFVARIAPSKRVELLIDALAALVSENVDFTASIVGSPVPGAEGYYADLKRRADAGGLTGRLKFAPGMPNDQLPDVYRKADLCVNLSPSGMFDKTLFEAAACGSLVLAVSEDWRELAGEPYAFSADAQSLAKRLSEFLSLSSEARAASSSHLVTIANSHSLTHLAERLHEELL